MSELMRAPMHGWLLYPVVRALLELTMDENALGDLLGKSKDPSQTRDLAMELLRLWFMSLKPRGGSFAGAVKSNGTDPDPTGVSNLPNVIAELTPDAGEHSARHRSHGFQ